MGPHIAGQEPRVLGFRRLLSGGQVSWGGVSLGDFARPGHTVWGVSEVGRRDGVSVTEPGDGNHRGWVETHAFF